jgi:hypothetical protein
MAAGGLHNATAPYKSQTSSTRAWSRAPFARYYLVVSSDENELSAIATATGRDLRVDRP